MQDMKPPHKPARIPGKDDKSARLAEALRANLARRKAQKRARAEQLPREEDQGN
ncbi:MAG: hypothetical protein KDK03_01165 [Rhodobacteraceae bacterium]|uniref:hypothetical protein n=1 Tax=Amaricoccus sp. B4 TaxID=3368557 RepID=UPI0013A6C517|nr:hypothetical protein [Paracoccaceae bacterium]